MADDPKTTKPEAEPHVGEAIRKARGAAMMGDGSAAVLIAFFLEAVRTDWRWSDEAMDAARILGNSLDKWVRDNGL